VLDFHHSEFHACCCVLQCVAVCCSVLQCFAACSTLIALGYSHVFQRVAVYYSVLQCIAMYCSVLQCVAVFCGLVWCLYWIGHTYCDCNTQQHSRHPEIFTQSRCSMLQCAAMCCSRLPRFTLRYLHRKNCRTTLATHRNSHKKAL